MEKEFIFIKMVINLKENSIMIKNMKVMNLLIMIIKIYMKEKLKKVKKMKKVKWFIIMKIYLMKNEKMILFLKVI